MMAVPRLPTAFVDRLQIDTTEKVLTKFLQDEGLQGVKCRKLATLKDRCIRCFPGILCRRYLFYIDNTWAEGAELRDWFLKLKPAGQINRVKLSDINGSD